MKTTPIDAQDGKPKAWPSILALMEPATGGNHLTSVETVTFAALKGT